MKKISIGSWAYCFGPYKDNPVDFHTVIHKLSDLGLDGVELELRAGDAAAVFQFGRASCRERV